MRNHVAKQDKQDIFEKYIQIAKEKADTLESKKQLTQIESYHNHYYTNSEKKAESFAEKQQYIPISFLVVVYNEESRIRYVIEHAIRWADEVIVANKSSTDRTKEICQEYGERVKVIDIPFSPRGHEDSVAISKFPSNDWIFFGPASEIPTRKLINKCRETLAETNGELDLVYVPRKYYSFGIHDKRSPWSISYFPFLLNRKKAIITNTIHHNFRPSNPQNTRAIEFSDDCCVYHLTHVSAKDYLKDMTDYFEVEAASCTDPDAKIQECFNNIARYQQQLSEGGEALLGHYLAWPIYWLGTALFVWEKKRGMDVAKFYKELREEVIKREWLDYDQTLTSDSPDSLNDSAVSKLKAGDKEGAKSILLDLIKRWPEYHVSYNNLACIFCDGGDIENAVKYFEDALRISNFDRSVVFSYGDMLMSHKKYSRAKEIFERYLRMHPDDSDVKLFSQKCESVLEKLNRLNQVVGKIK